MTIPKWTDEAAVEQWVGEIIHENALEEDRQFYNLPWETHPGVSASELFESMQRDAIGPAEVGNFVPMAAMLENPLTEVMKSKYNFRLSSRTMALLADGLRGKRSGRRGPRKQTAEELQANTPIHGAAAEVATIKPILSNAYENEKGIAEHAITIAAKRAKVSRKTLANYLRSRRRPRP